MSVLLLEDGTSRLLLEDGSNAVLLEEVDTRTPAGSPMAGRVLIAPGDNPLDPSPAWERFDMLENCRCSGYEISTGRQTEFDQTDTGTANVYFHDRARVLDDTNMVGSPIMLQVQNPVTSLWEPQWRGQIDEPNYDLEPSWAATSNVNLRCKDVFDYLAGAEMLPGVHGHPNPNTQAGGSVFWAEDTFQGRIEDMLGASVGAGLDPDMYVVFTGNIRVWQTNYEGDSFLVGVRDVVDAEFPGIANVFVDRFGRVNAHGRLARFDPDTTAAEAGHEAWNFQRWEAATREDVTAGRAQIRQFTYTLPKSRIYNAAISWPRWVERPDGDGIPFSEREKVNQVSIDGASIDRYGYRAFPPMGDLIVKEGIGEFNLGNTGAQECQNYALYYTSNYATPRRKIDTVTFTSIRPGDDRAEATWALMLSSDISDIITLTVDEAGIGNEDYYIEGFQKTVNALNPDYDMVNVTPNLSAKAYYTTNVFE